MSEANDRRGSDGTVPCGSKRYTSLIYTIKIFGGIKMVKKRIVILLSLLCLIILVLGACTSRIQPNTQLEQGSNTPGQKQQEDEIEGEITENSDQFDEDDEEVIVVDGTFVGFADNRTVEITVDDEPMTFTVTEKARNDIEQLEIDLDDRVMVKYREAEQGNPQMVAIEKIISE
jgi:hypothetical protein